MNPEVGFAGGSFSFSPAGTNVSALGGSTPAGFIWSRRPSNGRMQFSITPKGYGIFFLPAISQLGNEYRGWVIGDRR